MMQKLPVFLWGVLASFSVLAQPLLPTLHLLQAGIGITPSGKRQQLITYPESVLQKQVVSVHIGKVAGRAIVMLATHDNRLFTLSLNMPNRWHQVAQPDLRYGSYHVHDFIVTPTGHNTIWPPAMACISRNMSLRHHIDLLYKSGNFTIIFQTVTYSTYSGCNKTNKNILLCVPLLKTGYRTPRKARQYFLRCWLSGREYQCNR